jgi:hypothetical protein
LAAIVQCAVTRGPPQRERTSAEARRAQLHSVDVERGALFLLCEAFHKYPRCRPFAAEVYRQLSAALGYGRSAAFSRALPAHCLSRTQARIVLCSTTTSSTS